MNIMDLNNKVHSIIYDIQGISELLTPQAKDNTYLKAEILGRFPRCTILATTSWFTSKLDDKINYVLKLNVGLIYSILSSTSLAIHGFSIHNL